MGYEKEPGQPLLRKPVARFEKVSLEEYLRARDCTTPAERKIATAEWEQITLPDRATTWSAGYDFYIPCHANLSKEPLLIPTGIRVRVDYDWLLMLVPRSGLGFKYGVRLANTCGIIDADYYYANNEGHIMAKLTSEIPLSLRAGDRFMQGIFVPYGVAEEKPVEGDRTGGMGSTGT